MPVVVVTSGRHQGRMTFPAGMTLREVLNAQEAWTTSYCGGAGTCGRCRVKVEGLLPQPTPAELARLSAEDLRRGVRLACQLRPVSDLRVTLLGVDAAPDWRDIPALSPGFHAGPGPTPAWVRPDGPLGAAIDLGTTHVRASVWDVGTRTLVARRWTLNPQVAFGADVLTRLAFARDSPEDAATMREVLVKAIGDALRDLAAEVGRPPSAIGRVVLVGNTAMLALMGQCDGAALLDPDTWGREVAWEPRRAIACAGTWGLAGRADVHFARPLAGFVGSDLTASVAATSLCDGPAGSLLIDFGTNSELALWDGEHLWVTSAAGGPAFEGAGMSCGMPATAGAIRRARLLDRDSLRFECDVIGGGAGQGLTGPAVVDVIASLVDAGVILRGGMFAVRSTPAVTIQHDPPVAVSRRDVDTFQRAKAAIAAAATLLVDRTGDGRRALRRVCVCGVFGEHLQIDGAQRIGLLPPVDAEAVELHGQAALAGAERWLFADDAAASVAAVARRVRVFNLAHDAGYDACFIDNLRLQPMPTWESWPC